MQPRLEISSQSQLFWEAVAKPEQLSPDFNHYIIRYYNQYSLRELEQDVISKRALRLRLQCQCQYYYCRRGLGLAPPRHSGWEGSVVKVPNDY
jgi:hypothetical protein